MFSEKSRSSTWYMQVVSIPVFFVIFFIGLYQVITEQRVHNNRGETKTQENEDRSFSTFAAKSGCTIDGCSVSCAKMDYNTFVDTLKKKEDEIAYCSNGGGIDLQLTNIDFPDNTISEGWLGDFTFQLNTTLSISSKTLEELGPRAFAGPQFNRPISVHIEDSKITKLQKHSFEGSKIFGFKFIYNQWVGVLHLSAEEGALDEIADYLALLQFQMCIDDGETIKNMLGKGSKVFTQLWYVDLRMNTFAKLASESFVNIKKLTTLYLDSGGLKEIELEAFAGLEDSITELDLKGSSLTSFPQGLFKNFRERMPTQPAIIHIEQNKWDCSCEFEWFKDFFYCYKDSYFSTVNFLCDGVKNYTEVDFCPSKFVPSCETTTTTTSTAISTDASSLETSSTTETPNMRKVDCIAAEYVQESTDMKYIATSYSVKNRDIAYCFKQNKNNSFVIHIEGFVSNSEVLMWHKVDDKNDYGCKLEVKEQENILMNSLIPGASYVVCLMNNKDYVLEPSDCTTLAVPLDYGLQPWITNKNKVFIVSGIIVGIVFVSLVSSFVVYYVIRSNPELISSKEIVIQKKSENEQRNVETPSIFNEISDGYETPKCKTYYSEIKKSQSVAEISLYSENVYETPALPPNHPPFIYTFHNHN